MKRNLFVFTLCLFLCGAAQAQTVDEIFENYFENTGGLKEWKKMKSIKMEGEVNAQGMQIPAVVYTKAPNMIKMEMSINGMMMIPQAFDGDIAWSINPFQGGTDPVKMTEEQTKELKNDVVFEPLYIDYKKKGHEITLEGKEEIDGAECFKLKVVKNKNNDKEESIEYHFFDTENFVPIMIRTTGKSGQMKGMTIETFLSDYQEAGNVIMPYYTEQKIGGQSAFKMTVKKVIIDEKMDDAIFTFPGK